MKKEKFGQQKVPPAPTKKRRLGSTQLPPGRHPGRSGLYGQPRDSHGYSDMKQQPKSGTRK